MHSEILAAQTLADLKSFLQLPRIVDDKDIALLAVVLTRVVVAYFERKSLADRSQTYTSSKMTITMSQLDFK